MRPIEGTQDMPAVKTDLKRLQFELSSQRLEEFERLVHEGGFESRKDLLNNALTLIKWAMTHAKNGHAIAAIDEKSQRSFELQMPFLSHVTASADASLDESSGDDRRSGLKFSR